MTVPTTKQNPARAGPVPCRSGDRLVSSVRKAGSALASSPPKTTTSAAATSTERPMRDGAGPRRPRSAASPRRTQGSARIAATGPAAMPRARPGTVRPPATASEPASSAPSTQYAKTQPSARSTPAASSASAAAPQPSCAGRARRCPAAHAVTTAVAATVRPVSSQPSPGRFRTRASAATRPVPAAPARVATDGRPSGPGQASSKGPGAGWIWAGTTVLTTPKGYRERSGGDRESDPDPAAGGGPVDDGDAAAVQLHHPVRDGQAQAGAAAVPGGALAPGEPLEHPGALVGRDPGTLVGDVEDQVLGLPAGGDGDGAAGGAVPGGVVEQVRDHLVQPARVGDGLARFGVDAEAHVATGRTGGDLGLPYRHRQEPGHVEGLQVQRYHPGLDPGQVEQLGDQPAEALGLGQRGPQGVRVGDAVDDVLQHRLYREDGGTQLERHVRDQFPPLPVRRREVPRHLVERDRELAHLVPRGGPDPQAVVPARNRLV